MSDETSTEAETITANVAGKTEKNATECEKSEIEAIDTDESNKDETSNQKPGTESSNDLFDALKDSETVECEKSEIEAIDTDESNKDETSNQKPGTESSNDLFDALKDSETVECEKSEIEAIDTDESNTDETSDQKPETESSNDIFDALKESETGESKSENQDAIDGEIVSQEPMEVDEPQASDSEDTPEPEPEPEPEPSNEPGNETEQQENSSEENAPQGYAPQDETSQDNDQPESSANDERDCAENGQSMDAVTEMEVDQQSSQDETDRQPSQGKDEVDKIDKADDSLMDQNMEHFNCSTVTEAPKDKTMADDPFDSLLNNDIADTSSVQNDSAAQNEITAPEDSVANDNEQHDENDDDDDSGSHHDDAPEGLLCSEAVDDIEEGKDADEELLPDEEREISEAEKRQAEAYQQEAENEDRESEINEEQIEDQSPEANIEENGEKETTENETQAEEAGQEIEPAEPSQADAGEMQFMPKPNEIREIDFEQTQESPCLECGLVTKCKYTLLKEVPSDEDDTDSAPKNVVHFLCDSPCASAFSDSNPQYKVIVKKVAIAFVVDTEQSCRSCQSKKMCRYRFKDANDAETFAYICDEECLNQFTSVNLEKYVLTKNRFIIEETSADVADTKQKCYQCSEELKCKYTFKDDNVSYYLCHGPCLNLLLAEQPDRFRIKRQSIRVKDLPKRTTVSTNATTTQPKEIKRTQQPASEETGTKMVARTEEEARLAEADREASFCRRCAHCYTDILLNDSSLQWEAMDFCNESCLGQYQTGIGAACQHCQNAVSVMSMGKYCVRFGFELRQFCRSACLDAYKKGLKVCTYCQKDIAKNKAKILATINGQYKDFCSKLCMRSYDQIFSTKRKPLKICNVCNNSRQVRVEVVIGQNTHNFCSNPCYSAFKFVNNISPDNCTMCRKYFERKSTNAHTIYQDDTVKMFCSKICMTIFIITKRVISPCQWCKVRKYDFDMVQKLSGPYAGRTLCSLNCMQMFAVSVNAIAKKKQKCDQCNSMGTPQYHLTMSDASMRNFCTYQCVMSFQSQFSRAPLTLDESERSQPIPTGLPKRIKNKQAQVAQTQATTQKTATPRIAKVNSLNPAQKKTNSNNLVISSVTSLAAPTRSTRRSQGNNTLNVDMNRLQPVVSLEPLPSDLIEKTISRPVGRPRNIQVPAPTRAPTPPPPEVRVETKTHIVTVPPLPKKVANASTMCKVDTHNKEIQARPMQFTVGCQTDSWLEQKMVIPIPVPIYMPCPTNMYVQPFPCPVPIPLPIPVPVFIPTTRNSSNGIMKEIKKIQDKMPADPFEAELLMMAEMVAGESKKEDDTDSSDEETTNHFQNEEISGNNFGDDMLQMALKTIYPTDFEPHSVDLEQSMQANTITPHTQPGMAGHDVMQQQPMMIMEDQRMQTRKRGAPTRGRQPAKRGRRSAIQEPPPPQPEPQRECAVMKADENMYLKFTFGVNAWKQWVMTKNAELEKSSMRRKLFKTELLQLTADELNYSLCLFVKEVRKPNGSEYAPDTIYYLVLGIQEYLYENGRIDNIFTDPYYERFTDCLDEVAKKFSVLYNDSQYIVTRVEEEHLWECKQLGAHSPHVLLSTLMFFNTKHFNLTTVEEHMQLSFSHIMKHWKRNQNQGSAKMPGSRNVLLRFYPPQSANIDSRKKKVYEQQENEENPLRCPVKLYEFYLSKCPESVKTRNDVFYLLPERSCVPDSPVWYSTQALGEKALSKMLHRVKMVKEINIALLTS